MINKRNIYCKKKKIAYANLNPLDIYSKNFLKERSLNIKKIEELNEKHLKRSMSGVGKFYVNFI